MAEPVLLIHGLKDSARKMERMARHLRSHGREVHTLSLIPSWGQQGLEVLAQQVADWVEQNRPPLQKLDLVGFSMGGLVCRYYLQRLGGLARVRRFVTVSAPHAGSWLAWLIANPGCRQMRPGSSFLRDLERDAAGLASLERFTSLWTPFDLTILPATSSIMSVGRSERLWCVAHPLMVWQRSCLEAVARALA